jgi:hypothetical protein
MRSAMGTQPKTDADEGSVNKLHPGARVSIY